jgi:putative aldouronate transport system permease protein
VVINSISYEHEILSTSFKLFPKEINTDNWEKILQSRMMWKSFMNSVYVTVAGSVYSLFLSITYAYPLSRRDLPYRNFFTFVLVFTMFFGGGIIPYYLLMRSMGLVNKLEVLIIGGISVWNTLIIRNYFMTIPDSLPESARIDGASEAKILFRIILPLAKPVLATVLLWNLVGGWNSWVSCLIYINDPNKMVIQIVLRNILKQDTFNILSMNDGMEAEFAMKEGMRKAVTNEGMKAAVLLFATLPILVSYPFLQKYFVKGIMIGSLKG